jgi:plastocyanin
VRKLYVILLCVAAFALCVPPGTAKSASSVRVSDRAISPETLTVNRGTVVTWRFVGRRRHRLSVLHGPVKFRTPTLRRGTFRKRLTRAGVYHIVCVLHPHGHQMFISVH